ncbi:LysR family transcriptional regulator [Enterococcus faecalis]
MNMNDLLIFKTIYEEQTINKTAKKLGYAQSNITARLKAIEDECNVKLFMRNYKGVVPTINGKDFYSFALNTLSEFEILKGKFSVITSKLLTSELLLKYLVYDNQITSIESTKIICKKTEDISFEIEKEYYDYVVTFEKINKAGLVLISKHQFPTSFLCCDLNKKNSLPFLINSDISCPLRKLTLELFKETERIVEIDSLETILNLVTNGKGIALLPTYLKSEGYIPIDNNIFHINYYKYRHNK